MFGRFSKGEDKSDSGHVTVKVNFDICLSLEISPITGIDVQECQSVVQLNLVKGSGCTTSTMCAEDIFRKSWTIITDGIQH